jgi:hypothetical protein
MGGILQVDDGLSFHGSGGGDERIVLYCMRVD